MFEEHRNDVWMDIKVPINEFENDREWKGQVGFLTYSALIEKKEKILTKK